MSRAGQGVRTGFFLKATGLLGPFIAFFALLFGLLFIIFTSSVLGGVAADEEAAQIESASCRSVEDSAGGSTVNVPEQFKDDVKAASKVAGIPEQIIAAQIQAESNWNASVCSAVGACGLTQFMPGTWALYGEGDQSDPHQAIKAQGKYMKTLMDQMSSLAKGDADLQVRLALASYNAGPGAVQAAGGIPAYPETQGYVQKIMGSAQMKYSGDCKLVTGQKVWDGDLGKGEWTNPCPGCVNTSGMQQRLLPVDAQNHNVHWGVDLATPGAGMGNGGEIAAREYLLVNRLYPGDMLLEDVHGVGRAGDIYSQRLSSFVDPETQESAFGSLPGYQNTLTGALKPGRDLEDSEVQTLFSDSLESVTVGNLHAGDVVDSALLDKSHGISEPVRVVSVSGFSMKDIEYRPVNAEWYAPVSTCRRKESVNVGSVSARRFGALSVPERVRLSAEGRMVAVADVSDSDLGQWAACPEGRKWRTGFLRDISFEERATHGMYGSRQWLEATLSMDIDGTEYSFVVNDARAQEGITLLGDYPQTGIDFAGMSLVAKEPETAVDVDIPSLATIPGYEVRDVERFVPGVVDEQAATVNNLTVEETEEVTTEKEDSAQEVLSGVQVPENVEVSAKPSGFDERFPQELRDLADMSDQFMVQMVDLPPQPMAETESVHVSTGISAEPEVVEEPEMRDLPQRKQQRKWGVRRQRTKALWFCPGIVC